MYVILGAGIAGLSAAYFLKQQGIQATVLEQRATYGGLARSFLWNGFCCDFAAHRLFTHDQDVLQTIQNLVPLHRHERRSQIYLFHSWMNDPIDVLQLIAHLSNEERFQLLTSYLQRDTSLPEDTFEHFVMKRYGSYLYTIFFQSYTERLFTLPGNEVDVEWARRKVRLASPVDRFRQATKTKFSAFYYPIQGGYGAIASALYEAVADHVIFNARVTGLTRDAENGDITSVEYEHQGTKQRIDTTTVLSTLPMTVNARLLGIDMTLDYQKVDAVYLWLNKPYMTPNHWLYFMDSASVINRLVEFKHMSADEVDPYTTVVCAEVTRELDDPVTAVANNLVQSGVVQHDEIRDGMVLREPFSYPRYRTGYPALLQSFANHPTQPQNIHYLGRAAQFDHLEVDDLIGAVKSFVHNLIPTPHEIEIPARTLPMKPVEPQPEVWIVLLTWNNYADTAECLDSLRRLAYPNYKIVLVDNGSTDGTPHHVRTSYPEVIVLENGANLGVPTGYNVGFRYALQRGAQYIFMLNNDTIVDATLLSHLIKAARAEPSAGVFSPVFYYYDEPDMVWAAGARYRRFPPAIVFERRLHRPAQGYHELEYAVSCGLLITRRAFEKSGLFDENFRFLWDDYEFSARVRKHGLKILQVPDAKLWHKISRTTKHGSPLYWQVHGESGAIFYRRHSRLTAVSMAIHLGYFAVREFAWNRWYWSFLLPYARGLFQGITRPLKDVPHFKDGLSYPG